MYKNDTRGLEGLGQPDASLENDQTWTTRSAFERELLIAIACLERANHPTTAYDIKATVECWESGVSFAGLHQTLTTLKDDNLVAENPLHQSGEYSLTRSGHELLESYINQIQKICTRQSANSRETVSIELEHPITPGDLEAAYCKLLQSVMGAPR